MPIDEAAVTLRAKAELRKRLRALRQTTPASALALRSERIVARLLAMDVVARAKSVALFWPITERHEVDLGALDTALRARGVAISYPFVDDATHEMTFRTCAPPDLVKLSLGFHGPPSTAEEAKALDVIVVPALGLDEHGRRLGYGVGYYDRTLGRFPMAVTIGVAYDFQLLAEVPVSSHDIAMQWVVTDTRTLEA